MKKIKETIPLTTALARAQGEFGEIVRNKTVTVYPRKRSDGFQPKPYTFAYADLGEILAKTRPALAKHDIAVTQGVTYRDNDRPGITTTLHYKAEKISFWTPLMDIKGEVSNQQFASACTYARRHGMSALLCVAADADDDGNAADGNDWEQNQGKRATAQPKPAAPKPKKPESKKPAGPIWNLDPTNLVFIQKSQNENLNEQEWEDYFHIAKQQLFMEIRKILTRKDHTAESIAQARKIVTANEKLIADLPEQGRMAIKDMVAKLEN